jgi:hypothetical protein
VGVQRNLFWWVSGICLALIITQSLLILVSSHCTRDKGAFIGLREKMRDHERTRNTTHLSSSTFTFNVSTGDSWESGEIWGEGISGNLSA